MCSFEPNLRIAILLFLSKTIILISLDTKKLVAIELTPSVRFYLRIDFLKSLDLVRLCVDFDIIHA